MRVLLLFAGFAAGFAALFFWTKSREPQIVSATYQSLVVNKSEAPQVPAGPPVNMAKVKELQDKIAANPKDYASVVELGNIHFDQRNFVDAASFYEKALAIKGDDLDVRTDLGTMLFYLKRHDEALVELNRVLAVNPTHAQALFNLGIVYLHGKNEPQKALQAWQTLVAKNPNFPQLGEVKAQIENLKASLKK